MVSTIQYRHISEIKRADTIKAGYIDTKLRRVGATLMVSVNATYGTKIMLRGVGIELVKRQRIFALGDFYVSDIGRDDNGTPHTAK